MKHKKKSPILADDNNVSIRKGFNVIRFLRDSNFSLRIIELKNEVQFKF